MNLNLLEHLLLIDDRFGGITEQSILNEKDEVVGWNCFIVDKAGKTISGGTSSSKEVALRIGIAETFERALARKCWKSADLRNYFLQEQFQSTCGFASGFDNMSTRFRAICEGLERWVWSNWIDFNFYLPETSHPTSLTPLATTILRKFEQYKFYSKNFILPIDGNSLKLRFSLFIGIRENGVFTGSRVTTAIDDPWEHSLIEAYRNLNNYSYYKENPEQIDQDNIIALRSHYFATNKASAFEQIEKAKKSEWPQPKVLILRDMNTNIPSVFLWRCILRDFVSWDIGDDKRFVY